MSDTELSKVVLDESVEKILRRNGVYSIQLEMELLRHFENLRNELLKSIKLPANDRT